MSGGIRVRITPTDNIILMSDPTVAAIPVEECGEPLVNLAANATRTVRTPTSAPASSTASTRRNACFPPGSTSWSWRATARPLCNAPTSTRTWPNSAPSTATGTPSTSP